MKHRSIKLNDGTIFKVSLKEELLKKIKEEYSVSVVSDNDIKKFFEDVLSDAIRNATTNSSDAE